MKINNIQNANLYSNQNYSLRKKNDYSLPTFTAKNVSAPAKKGIMGTIGLGLISLGALMLKRPKDKLFVEPSELEKELEETKDKLEDTKFKLENVKNKLWKANRELEAWESSANNPTRVIKEFFNFMNANRRRPHGGRYNNDPILP